MRPPNDSDGIEPLHFLAALVSGALLIVLARGPIRDVDLWWHRVIGEEIWRTRSVTGLGNAWAPFGDQGWVSTQWASEVGFFWVHQLGGWDAILLLRIVLAAVLMAGLAWALLRGRPARAAVPVYTLVLLGLLPGLTQDRVQTLALALAVPLAAWAAGVLRGQLPRWWMVALLAVVWANLHGSWILLPAVLGLALLAVLADHRLRPLWRRLSALIITASVSGLLTPASWDSATALLRFRERTAHVTEWALTQPADVTILPFSLLAVMLVVAWARQRPVPVAELIMGLGLIAFGMTAFRNVLFAMVLVAPLLADRLSMVTRAHPAARSEARALSVTSIGVVIACLVASVVIATRVDPLADARALKIAQYLATEQGPKRILNDYNTAGVLVAFGGDGVEVSIDGRADRYPADYTERYLGALAQLIDWEQVVAEITPDFAVLHADSALRTHLLSLEWKLVMDDDEYSLLAPPTYGPGRD